jgi:pSer/pThr/pTyr-binding forkhead associated (FHA) protein
MPMYLVPVDEGEPIILDKAIMFVGRHPDCDLVLTHSRKVSRKHCCIAQINDSYVVRDLGSMNGVRVNDDAVQEEVRVRPGDELWIGDVGFRLEFRSVAPARKSGEDSTRPHEETSPAPSLRSAKLDRRFISQDLPVAIPEEGADVIVEQTKPRLRPPPQPGKEKSPPQEEVIKLRDDDILDDDDD